MNEDLTHTLADGRTLGYAEYGDPQGRPVFFFHGFPGTRHLGRAVHPQAAAHGLRVLSPDRPGFGLSSLKPGRSITDWPADVTALADALTLESFGVLGVSGGGPYALACARLIPEQLTGVALVGGMGPLDAPNATEGMSGQNRFVFGLGRWFPRLVGMLMVATMKGAQRDPDKMFARMRTAVPPPDQRVMDGPGFRDVVLASMKPSPHTGRAVAQEMSLYTTPWGFALREIEREVHIFQGELDRNVPPGLVRWVAEQLPKSRAHFYPEEGHLSVFANRGAEILGVFG